MGGRPIMDASGTVDDLSARICVPGRADLGRHGGGSATINAIYVASELREDASLDMLRRPSDHVSRSAVMGASGTVGDLLTRVASRDVQTSAVHEWASHLNAISVVSKLCEDASGTCSGTQQLQEQFGRHGHERQRPRPH